MQTHETLTRVTSQTQMETGNLEFVLSDATGAAEAALIKALAFCAGKMALEDTGAVVDGLRKGDPSICHYFHYNLAVHVAEWLGTWDEDLKAVYLYDVEATPEDVAFGQVAPSLLCLIVWAKRKTGALNSMIEAIDRALIQGYARLLGASQRSHLLAVQVIDDDDVKNRIGCVALLTSVHLRPIKIWER